MAIDGFSQTGPDCPFSVQSGGRESGTVAETVRDREEVAGAKGGEQVESRVGPSLRVGGAREFGSSRYCPRRLTMNGLPESTKGKGIAEAEE